MSIYLFDLDGTLVDSREPILRAMNTAFENAGLDPMTDTELDRHVGPPLQDSLRSLLGDRGASLDLVDTLIDGYREAYRVTSIELAVSYSGIAELLETLSGRVRLGVVTSKPLVYTNPILDALGFAAGMEVVEGPGLAGGEPKTVTLARALRLLGVAAGRVTMVGDRHHDVEAGRANGTRTIGVTWGFGSHDELESAGADHITDRPDEIGQIALG